MVFGQAAQWQGLAKALHRLGHRVILFEQGSTAPAERLPGIELLRYPSWQAVGHKAAIHLADADAAIVTSSCPNAALASDTVLSSPTRVRCYYDLDAGITLDLLRSGKKAGDMPEGGLADFDVVLSSTGGLALAGLKTLAGARHVAPLYPCVDPEAFRPSTPETSIRANLSYLATDQSTLRRVLEDLFLEPARRRPDLRFVLSGLDPKDDDPETEHVVRLPRVPAAGHAAFYSSSQLTLHLTPAPVAEMGYCPSPGLFEAAACGATVISDEWEGLDYFFDPGREILVARTTGHVMDALAMSTGALARIARAGRERVLAMHSADRRALDLENILEAAVSLPVEQAGTARE